MGPVGRRALRAQHKVAHSTCPNGADNWAACDKVADARHADWQAMQTVLLAYKVASEGRTRAFKGDKGVLAQLVRYIAGEQEEILNGDGNPHQSVEVKRLRAAISRVIAGKFPAYNLYILPAPAGAQEEA